MIYGLINNNIEYTRVKIDIYNRFNWLKLTITVYLFELSIINKILPTQRVR